MRTNYQFANSSWSYHYFLLMLIPIFFCRCNKEDSIADLNMDIKTCVKTRISHNEYLEYSKLPQICKMGWSQIYPFPPFLNIQIQQGQGKYDRIQLGTSSEFNSTPSEYSFFPIREINLQEKSYAMLKIPLADLQLPEGGYIAVRATCSELVTDPPYPPNGLWNPYANFIGYDFDKEEATFSKAHSIYGNICFRFPESGIYRMCCDILITGSGYWEPIVISAIYDPDNDSPIQYRTFSYDTKGDEVSFAYRSYYSNPTHFPQAVHFKTTSEQTSIFMLTFDVPMP